MSANVMTVGQLAKRFGLSRSTLLYYDSIGLLKPSGRSRANYRRYTEEDAERLEKICTYRQMRLSMASIAGILQSPRDGVRDVLENRLLELGREIRLLREQQQVIIRMLGEEKLRDRYPVLDRERWVAILRAAGLDDEGLLRWHKGFEKLSPRSHQEFLEGLGIAAGEIEAIRRWSRE
jgi:MerR family transcriptional regulator, thiopeptide resistance regulator